MGSKTPKTEYEGSLGHSSASAAVSNNGGEARGSHLSRDGDGCLGDGGDDDGDGDQADGHGCQIIGDIEDAATTQKPKKPNKKKRKKKPKAGAAGKQTSPPRVPLKLLYPSGQYPKGELQSYATVDQNTARTTSVEIRHDGRQHWNDKGFLSDYRQAAEIHRQTRHWFQKAATPGTSVQELVLGVEDSVRALLDNAGLEPGDGLKSGLGFPTGLCINHQVAHYTPNPGQKDVVLQQKDVVTLDFGVHINGWIVDSAFTMAFDPVYDNLLAAVKDATNTGIRTAGVDVRISDVSAAIQEAMESYEVEIDGKAFPVKAVRNLTGHNIRQYHIHGGKSIPFVKNADQTKMEEGEVFAIETFGSTGRGRVHDYIGVYGYGLRRNAPLPAHISSPSARRLHKTIRENFGTIVFCRRYLDRLGVEKYLAGMNCLVANGIVEEYGPLADIKGSYSAQFEHTFLLGERQKEVMSRGEDY